MKEKYTELRHKMYDAAFAKGGECAELLQEAANAIASLEYAAEAATAKQQLLRLAELNIEKEKLWQELYKEWFEDVCYFDAVNILIDCTIDDEGLKNADGEIISRENGCIDEPLGYFVNQSCGCCEDDYYGEMYFPVDDKGTVVVVSYHC